MTLGGALRRASQGARLLNNPKASPPLCGLLDDCRKRLPSWHGPLLAQESLQGRTASSSVGALGEELRAAVVGSGPAGMYTVQKLLKQYGDAVKVDVLDRLPTPFGLVRSGVAADHAETKNVTNQFSSILEDSRVRFFGNVHLGNDIKLPQLQEMYNAIVLTYGTEADRRLGIPGEDLSGVFSAREFVWWFNGHPDAADLPVDLTKVKSVAILGLGNVALDCARILLQSPSGPLAATDISSKALDELCRSSVDTVHIIGRRGIAQAQFTGKELKEILYEVPGIQTAVAPEMLELTDQDSVEIKGSRQKRRVVELITKAAQQGSRSPVEILAGPEGASRLKLEKNLLTGGGEGAEQRAAGTGEFEELPVGMVLTCIGYRALPVEGLPFDDKSGLIPNTHGRVAGSEGVYVGGWVGRGPSGKIGSNLADANDIGDMIEEDRLAGRLPGRRSESDLAEVLLGRGVEFVDLQGWAAIDAAEVKAGQARSKTRDKLLDVRSMLDTSHAEPSA